MAAETVYTCTVRIGIARNQFSAIRARGLRDGIERAIQHAVESDIEGAELLDDAVRNIGVTLHTTEAKR